MFPLFPSWFASHVLFASDTATRVRAGGLRRWRRPQGFPSLPPSLPSSCVGGGNIHATQHRYTLLSTYASASARTSNQASRCLRRRPLAPSLLPRCFTPSRRTIAEPGRNARTGRAGWRAGAGCFNMCGAEEVLTLDDFALESSLVPLLPTLCRERGSQRATTSLPRLSCLHPLARPPALASSESSPSPPGRNGNGTMMHSVAGANSVEKHRDALQDFRCFYI